MVYNAPVLYEGHNDDVVITVALLAHWYILLSLSLSLSLRTIGYRIRRLFSYSAVSADLVNQIKQRRKLLTCRRATARLLIVE